MASPADAAAAAAARPSSWVVLVGACVLACSSEALDYPEDEPARPASILAEDYPGRLADTLCAAITECCAARSLSVDAAGCRDDLSARYDLDLAATLALNVRYDAAAAARCVDSLEASVATCRLSGEELALPPCDAVFTGTVPAGEACADSLECAPSEGRPAYCEKEFDAALGVCTPSIAEDETCFGPGCGPGLFCDLFSVSCRPQQTSGECLLISACARESVCSPEGQCVDKLADGVACQLDLQCEGGICDLDGTCARTLASDVICGG